MINLILAFITAVAATAIAALLCVDRANRRAASLHERLCECQRREQRQADALELAQEEIRQLLNQLNGPARIYVVRGNDRTGLGCYSAESNEN